MSAWGNSGSMRSCDSLLKRVEANDAKLKELVVLPMKKFGSQEVFRLAKCLESGRNTNLRSLQASGHAVGDVDALEALGRALVLVETIAIGDSEMGDDGVCALCRGLESNESVKDGSNGLKTIDLSCKKIEREGLVAILRVFTKLPSLQSIDLSRNETIGPSFDFRKVMSSLSLPMPVFRGLTHLDLSGCGLDAQSLATLLTAMKNEQGSIESPARNLVLNLNSNDLSDRGHLKTMMNLLATGRIVTELSISSCQIGDEGIKEFVDECFCFTKSNLPRTSSDDKSNGQFLRKLNLSNNNVASIEHLANRLDESAGEAQPNDCHYLSDLQSLNLSGNPLGQNLLAGIQSNTKWISSLEDLDLSHTSCEVPGAIELISRSNTRNSRLKRLNLFGNSFGSEGFMELSKVLHGGHRSLDYLDLGGNGATEHGVIALVEVLKNSMGDSSEDGEYKSAEEATENTLRVLVVGGNTGGPALEKVVKEVQKVHPDLDVARDKPKTKNNAMAGNNMLNNTPGTTWTS